MYYVVDLPLTDRNSKYIFIIVDQLTQYSTIYPKPDRTAKTAANCIYDFTLKFEVPENFLVIKIFPMKANSFKN